MRQMFFQDLLYSFPPRAGATLALEPVLVGVNSSIDCAEP